MPDEIPEQKKKTPKPVSPERQKLLDQIKALKDQDKAIRDKEYELKRQARMDRTTQAFTVFSYIERHLGDQAVKSLLEQVTKDISPKDLFTPEKADEAKAAMRRLIDRK